MVDEIQASSNYVVHGGNSVLAATLAESVAGAAKEIVAVVNEGSDPRFYEVYGYNLGGTLTKWLINSNYKVIDFKHGAWLAKESGVPEKVRQALVNAVEKRNPTKVNYVQEAV